MRIEKNVDLNGEVVIDISLEDIVAAIAEDAESFHGVRQGLNNVAKFLKAIPDPVIAQLGEPSRKVVREFLAAAAERYREK